MKLAFCLFKYFPYGGLQRDFLRIAKMCLQQGHEVHVYTMSWEGEQEVGLHLHLVPVHSLQNHTRAREFVRQLQPLLATHSYDRVIGFNKMPGLDFYYAADVCLRARLALQHRWWIYCLPRYRYFLQLERAVFARGQSSHILLISPFQQAAFTHYYHTEPERLHLLPPGIARDRIRPPDADSLRAAMRHALALAPQDFCILMIGSGFKTKGVDRAIHALAALPAHLKSRTHLLIVGQDHPAVWQMLAQKYHIAEHVHFLGARKDVNHLLLAADVLLHPAYHENTGTVLLEAVVAGLPVLTLAHCGYAHYILEAQAGIVLSEPFSQAALNTALADMLISPKQAEWRANALQFAQYADIYDLPAKAAALITKARPTFHFATMMSLRGQYFRQHKNRSTQRVWLNGQIYFIKQHRGVGWGEIAKNLLQGKWPVLGAQTEWQAIHALQAIGISVPAVIAYEQRGVNPARRQSYLLMQALEPAISLEDLSKNWRAYPPAPLFKRKLITAVAVIARRMHLHGINHRDFYLCHFLLDLSAGEIAAQQQPKLWLIDLHRAQIRKKTPKRWVIKDLAGLYFSSLGIGLTQRDYYRFIQVYCNAPWREVIQQDVLFWQQVKARGECLS